PFLLTGFLGSEAIHHWISIPFFVIYFCILFRNGTLLVLIWNDHSLHEPIYYFLAMLAGTDLGMTLTKMPTVLGVLLLDQREIAQAACFTQSFFIHSLAIVESGILLFMAYDHFIAIHTPLRYNSILTNFRVMNIGLGVLMRGFMSILPLILSLYYALIYILILKTVMGIASGQEQAKALNTRVSHIDCPSISHHCDGTVSHSQVWKHAPHMVLITMSYVHFLFPPFMNPIIYSIKTKQIQRSIVRLCSGQSRA
uniref:Olfactory receptor family 51 subfamily B member 4 n=1 Tax=Macaca nemestrina TaxID=9545 RepID=A0A2K6CA97_MACNE